MIKNPQKQNGSALLVVIIILAIAIVGVLGFIVWQNFLSPKDSSENQQETTTQNVESNDIKLDKTYTMPKENISFDYPSTWTIETNYKVNEYGDDNEAKLTNKDGTELTVGIPTSGPGWPFGERIFGCPFDENYDSSNPFNQPLLCPSFEVLYSVKAEKLENVSIYAFQRTYPVGSDAKAGIDILLAKTGCKGTDRALCERPGAKTGFYLETIVNISGESSAGFIKTQTGKELIAILNSFSY